MIFLYIFLILNIYGASTTHQVPSSSNGDNNANGNSLDQRGNRDGKCKHISFVLYELLSRGQYYVSPSS